MLYIIGGTARTGKTTLAVRIAKEKGIPCISTDVLRNALWLTYPELKLKELSGNKDDLADELFPYFLRLFKNLHDKYEDYLIDGETFFPRHLATIPKDRLNMKAVFLGLSYTDLETITKTSKFNDWVGKMPTEEQEKIPAHLMELSEQFKNECEEFGFKYMDVYPDWDKVLTETYDYLLNTSSN